MTKLNQAIDIVNQTSDKNKAIETIMETLSVTKSNAFVYWTKAVNKVNGVTVTKAKKNPITETTPQQHRKMVKEIDEVIAELKASGIPQSPFPV